jgi:hypothetical protein
MTIDSAIVQKIKTNIRIKHTVLDDDIADTIAAALTDLRVCGVHVPVDTDSVKSLDPLILNAVKLYCKSEYDPDQAKSAEYLARYDKLKSCLMMAHEYAGTSDEGGATE